MTGMSTKKRRVYQKPIGYMWSPYYGHGGTGMPQPIIYGMHGLEEKHDALTIAVYNQFFSVPMMLIHVENSKV